MRCWWRQESGRRGRRSASAAGGAKSLVGARNTRLSERSFEVEQAGHRFGGLRSSGRAVRPTNGESGRLGPRWRPSPRERVHRAAYRRDMRRFGYALSIVFTTLVAYAILVWPGWAAVPFLTDDTWLVLPLLFFSMVVSVAINVLLIVRDPVWLRALGDAVNAAIAIAVGVRVWRVFPFDFPDPWPLVARILLGVAIVCSAIGFVASLVRVAVASTRPGEPRPL